MDSQRNPATTGRSLALDSHLDVRIVLIYPDLGSNMSHLHCRLVIAFLSLFTISSPSNAQSRPERLTVTLTSMVGGVRRLSQPNTCSIQATVENNTLNHLDKLIATAAVFTIDLSNRRARSTFNVTIPANRPCPEVFAAIQTNPNFATIERCAMEGIREGECLDMVVIRSTLAPGNVEAAQADAAKKRAALEARCKTYTDNRRCVAACPRVTSGAFRGDPDVACDHKCWDQFDVKFSDGCD